MSNDLDDKDKEEKKKVGRPKAEHPTKTIRVPEVLIPVVENLVESFRKTQEKKNDQ
jgi:hypothetical protein